MKRKTQSQTHIHRRKQQWSGTLAFVFYHSTVMTTSLSKHTLFDVFTMLRKPRHLEIKEISIYDQKSVKESG